MEKQFGEFSFGSYLFLFYGLHIFFLESPISVCVDKVCFMLQDNELYQQTDFWNDKLPALCNLCL